MLRLRTLTGFSSRWQRAAVQALAAVVALVSPSMLAAQAPLQQLIDRVDDAVVLITTQDSVGRKNGLGSGFLIDKSGLIATNYHVIRNAARATVQFRNGKTGTIRGFRVVDKQLDLAVLELEGVEDVQEVFDIQGAAAPSQGERVIAIGHPSGFQFTVTTGIVSALRTTKDLPAQVRPFLKQADSATWVQTNAAISRGNSGGPLLNEQGQVIGINTWVVGGQNLAFAIRVEHLRDVVKKSADAATPLPVPGSIVGPGELDDEVQAIVDRLSRRYEEFVLRARQATSRQEALRIAREEDPTPGHIQDLLSIAKKKQGKPVYHALVAACMIGRGNSKPVQEGVKQAVELLVKDHIQERGLDAAVVTLANLRNPHVRDLCRAIIADSPHPDLQGLACYYLSTNLLQTRNAPETDVAEAIAVMERIMEKYQDVELLDSTLGKIVEPRVFGVKNLRIGCAVPEIEGQDAEGKEFKLSDYRGKVVLLDFWADIYPLCQQMYAHKRLLMEKYKDKPFAVLGVSCDEEDQFRRVVREGKVTWRNWLDGRQGPITRRWNIKRFPTIVLLDQHGTIRYANLREKGLNLAIERLMAETENAWPNNLVPLGAAWDFVDDGSDQKTAWRETAFDSSRWKSGNPPLGYGDGDEATVIQFGASSQRKHLTSYFRHEFQLPDVSKIEDLVLTLWCDDGAVVFINGKEVARHNIDGPVTYKTKAKNSVQDDGNEPHFFRVDPSVLINGKNVVAAEVHQANQTSSDLSFNLSLGTNVSEQVRQKLEGGK